MIQLYYRLTPNGHKNSIMPKQWSAVRQGIDLGEGLWCIRVRDDEAHSVMFGQNSATVFRAAVAGGDFVEAL